MIPTSFYKIKFDDKTFYLFGEQHSHPNMCPPAKDVAFVDTLVKSVTEAHKDRKYDFLEPPVNRYRRDGKNASICCRKFGYLIMSVLSPHKLKNRKKSVNLRVLRGFPHVS